MSLDEFDILRYFSDFIMRIKQFKRDLHNVLLIPVWSADECWELLIGNQVMALVLVNLVMYLV